MSIWQLLAIAGGGALGCVLRYLLAQSVHRFLPTHFPYGILIVNITGCLLMGILAIVLLQRLPDNPLLRAALLIGFLGGFTTFSSFSLDTIGLLEQGRYFWAAIYVTSSVLLSLLATWCGIAIAKNVF